MTIQSQILVLIGLVAIGCSKTEPVTEISVADSGPMEELPQAKFNLKRDWPWWRGPSGNGTTADQEPPVKWSETKNIRWIADVPGRGHGSPVVVGRRVFLLTADEDSKVQSVLCYDRRTGRLLWRRDVHQGKFEAELHQDNTHASSTVACDGKRVFASFLNDKAIWLTALNVTGRQLWQTRVGSFDSWHGYGASPAVYKSLVIVAGDHKSGGFLAAIHRKTGKIRWRKRRPKFASYSSPAVVHAAGKDQLLISGCGRVASFNPNNGERLWSIPGTTELTVGTMVTDGRLTFASGGWPEIETLCVRADGSGKVLWRNRRKIYSTSLLVHDGYLYGVKDDGIAYCWKADTGKLAWRARLHEQFSASPVLAGGNIFMAGETGSTVVFKANPHKFERVARNKLGDEVFATPAICGNQIFLRVAHRGPRGRREKLYCIGHRD